MPYIDKQKYLEYQRWYHRTHPKKSESSLSGNVKSLCACGCGTGIWEKDNHSRSRRYVSGHNAKGQKLSIEQKKKISRTLGEKRGWITPINRRIRNSTEYQLWRKVILERDNNTCIWCGSTTQVTVDHIKPFSLFPELRFAVDNGRVLCKKCHLTTDTWGGRIYD